MKLRTRLTAAVVIVSSAGTFLLGGAAISDVRASKLSTIDHALNVVVAQVRADASDGVAAAMLAVDHSSVPIALGFMASGAKPIWLRDVSDESIQWPSVEQRRAAAVAPLTTSDGYRVAAVSLTTGETLLLASTVADIDAQTREDLLRVLWFWLGLSIVMAFLVRLLTRRDVRQIEQLVEIATAIAGGAGEVRIPDDASSDEVKRLGEALHSLVVSLQHALNVEQRSSQRMQEFLGDASHELRTPLTVIKGYLELLETSPGVDTAQRDRALGRMTAEAARMERLVNDLLFLAEVGAPHADDFENVDLSALVRVLSDDLAELQPGRRISSSIEGDIHISAPRTHVHRALANAFANIHRHTASDVAVHVSLRRDAERAVLVIEDAGPGLSPSMYAHGITHFQRFDKSRSRATGGSGLGMSIIAAVMHECGGDVAIAPSDLGGLKLTYRFPLAN